MLMERRLLHSLILGQSSKKCNRAIVNDSALKMLDTRITALVASSYDLRLATQPLQSPTPAAQNLIWTRVAANDGCLPEEAPWISDPSPRSASYCADADMRAPSQ
jgi:hypothetical protein